MGWSSNCAGKPEEKMPPVLHSDQTLEGKEAKDLVGSQVRSKAVDIRKKSISKD